jgi:hypothetical protein
MHMRRLDDKPLARKSFKDSFSKTSYSQVSPMKLLYLCNRLRKWFLLMNLNLYILPPYVMNMNTSLIIAFNPPLHEYL